MLICNELGFHQLSHGSRVPILDILRVITFTFLHKARCILCEGEKEKPNTRALLLIRHQFFMRNCYYLIKKAISNFNRFSSIPAFWY